ncbi:MAG: tRNA pseudouridine(55) synthase TruB [Sphingobacteriales bacterium]|jgi:tRNA pseudouridine55 synthase|nr:tRNA pseudouridine(55) synthase TruB [Sphingobacteriales bacterium]
MSTFDFQNGELLLVDKPLTWTSFDVVGKIRNSTRIKKIKVGHAGTLDPLATGLLIVCTGKLTKKVDEFLAEEKEYTGTITLGATTPSYDLETEVNQNFPIEHITTELIANAAQSFEGEIEQVSPAYSALRIDGERAYHKARRGEEVKMKSRKVTIEVFEITKIEMPIVTFRIVCSKGTYIRSIAHDFGKKLESGAHLSSLRRTRSGGFKIEDAWNLDTLIAKIKEERIQAELSENKLES